jgi:hypothetical protein
MAFQVNMVRGAGGLVWRHLSKGLDGDEAFRRITH